MHGDTTVVLMPTCLASVIIFRKPQPSESASLNDGFRFAGFLAVQTVHWNLAFHVFGIPMAVSHCELDNGMAHRLAGNTTSDEPAKESSPA